MRLQRNPKGNIVGNTCGKPLDEGAESNKQFCIHFGNITEVSHKYWSFMEKFGKEYQMMALVESHVPKARTPKLAKDVEAKGWKSFITPAQPSDKSEAGCKGGTFILARSMLMVHDVRAVCCDIPAINAILDEAIDWSCCMVQMRGLRFIVVVVYCTHGLGFKGLNMLKLGQIGQLLALLSLPFILVGDWNQPPHLLRASGWLGMVGAELIVPKEVVATCSNGGRLLDYGAVSPELRPLILDFAADPNAFWTPHLGLKLTLRGLPSEMMIRAVVAPKGFDFKKPSQIPVGQDDQVWEQCVADAQASWRSLAPCGPLSRPGRQPPSAKHSFSFCSVHFSGGVPGTMLPVHTLKPSGAIETSPGLRGMFCPTVLKKKLTL